MTEQILPDALVTIAEILLELLRESKRQTEALESIDTRLELVRDILEASR